MLKLIPITVLLLATACTEGPFIREPKPETETPHHFSTENGPNIIAPATELKRDDLDVLIGVLARDPTRTDNIFGAPFFVRKTGKSAIMTCLLLTPKGELLGGISTSLTAGSGGTLGMRVARPEPAKFECTVE